MKRLIKTRTGRKLHVANGSFVYCGMFFPESKVETVTGDVKKYDVCARCTNGMDVGQFDIANVNFI